MFLATSKQIYNISSYSAGLTKVSFDMQGNVNALKDEFSNIKEFSISDDEGNDLTAYKNLTFVSATVYVDNRVTVTFAFPEVSTLDSRILELQRNMSELDDIMAEFLYGGAF